MATLAAFFRREDAAAIAAAAARDYATQEIDRWRLRPLPCEDVYFYAKKIDNSRVVREADPVAGRRAWRAGAKAALVAGALIALIMPKALGMVAGYRVHLLARERDRLANEKIMLRLEESRLLSPDRLDQLARQYGLVNPDVKHVVFLSTKPADSTLALNITK